MNTNERRVDAFCTVCYMAQLNETQKKLVKMNAYRVRRQGNITNQGHP